MTWYRLEVGLLGVGILTAVVGKLLGLPLMISIGSGMFALVFVVTGLEGIVTRKMTWAIKWYSHETYGGVAAMALGALLVIAGLGFGALVAAQAVHQEQTLLALFFSRPGPVLLLLGGVMLLRGLGGVIGAAEWDQSAVSRFMNGCLERAAMSLLMLSGAALLFAGVLEIVAPSGFDRLVTFGWHTLLGVLGMH